MRTLSLSLRVTGDDDDDDDGEELNEGVDDGAESKTTRETLNPRRHFRSDLS